jgi:hypothetical protein
VWRWVLAASNAYSGNDPMIYGYPWETREGDRRLKLCMILKPGRAGIYLRMVLKAVQSGETIVIKENQYDKISSE